MLVVVGLRLREALERGHANVAAELEAVSGGREMTAVESGAWWFDFAVAAACQLSSPQGEAVGRMVDATRPSSEPMGFHASTIPAGSTKSARKRKTPRPKTAAVVAALHAMLILPEEELRRRPLAVALGERLGVHERTIRRVIEAARASMKRVQDDRPGLEATIVKLWDGLYAKAHPILSQPKRTVSLDEKRDEPAMGDLACEP